MGSGFSWGFSLGLATFMFYSPLLRRKCVVFIRSSRPRRPYFDVIACVEVLSAFAFWGAEVLEYHFWPGRLGTANPGGGWLLLLTRSEAQSL